MRRALRWLATAVALAFLAGWLAVDRHVWTAALSLALAYVAAARLLEHWPERRREP